jgi:hypothetical protein
MRTQHLELADGTPVAVTCEPGRVRIVLAAGEAELSDADIAALFSALAWARREAFLPC